MIQDLLGIIKKLETYKASPFPIISVYFSLPNDQQLLRPHLYLKFKKLLSEVVPEYEQRIIEDDIDYIGAYLQQIENIKRNQGIAIFSGGSILWEVIYLKHPFDDVVICDYSPYLSPLYEIASISYHV